MLPVAVETLETMEELRRTRMELLVNNSPSSYRISYRTEVPDRQMMRSRQLISDLRRFPTEVHDGQNERAEDYVNRLETILCFIEQKHLKNL